MEIMEKSGYHKDIQIYIEEGTLIELSVRQLEIVELVKKHAPVTGDQIAEMLGVSRPTLRSDLAILVMLGYVDAKPKVGYFLGNFVPDGRGNGSNLSSVKVKDVHSRPVIIRDTETVNEAVVMMFVENCGSLMVCDASGHLVGMVSRKDLLKVTLGNPGAPSMPISLVMTRQPNIVTVTPETTVIEAARKMIVHEVDSLPVISRSSSGDTETVEVIGRITKSNMTKLLSELPG
jgi:CBS domain-containing protein/biotin operon repressor